MKAPLSLRTYLFLVTISLPLQGMADSTEAENLQDSSYFLVASPLWTAATEDLKAGNYESAGDHLLAAGNQIVRRIQKRYESLDINNADQVSRIREMLDQASYAYEKAEDAYTLVKTNDTESKNIKQMADAKISDLDAATGALVALRNAKDALLRKHFDLKGWHQDLQDILDAIDEAGITDDCAAHVHELVTTHENPEAIKDTSTLNIIPL